MFWTILLHAVIVYMVLTIIVVVYRLGEWLIHRRRAHNHLKKTERYRSEFR